MTERLINALEILDIYSEEILAKHSQKQPVGDLQRVHTTDVSPHELSIQERFAFDLDLDLYSTRTIDTNEPKLKIQIPQKETSLCDSESRSAEPEHVTSSLETSKTKVALTFFPDIEAKKKRIQTMAASFINYRDKTRVRPQVLLKRPKWIKEVETVPHLQVLLRDNQATSGASHIYNDKSHWYPITGINSFNEQTSISAFTGNPSGKKYCIHGEVGKLVAQQLQKPNKIWAGVNGHRSTEPIQLESGGGRLVDIRKQCSKYQDFMKEIETKNMDLESTLIPLSIEDQMNKSNIKIISLSPQQEIPPQVESEPCPFDLHSWNQKVDAIKELGGLHSFSSVDTQSRSRSHERMKSFDKPLELPVKTVKKATKSCNQQIYLLADDGTTRPLKTKQYIKNQPVKDIITLICEMQDQLGQMQNITSDRPLPGADKVVTNVLDATPGVVCPKRPLTTACTISPCHRSVNESLKCEDLVEEQKLKHKDISVTNRYNSTISNKTSFHFTAKALQCLEEKNTNEKGPAFGLHHESSFSAPKLGLSLSCTNRLAIGSIAHKDHESKPECKLSPIIDSKEKPNGNILKSIATDPGAQTTSTSAQSSAPESAATPAPKHENSTVSSHLKTPPASLIIKKLEGKSEDNQSMEDREMKEAVEFQPSITSAGTTQSPVNNTPPTQGDNLSISREENLKVDEQLSLDQRVSLEKTEPGLSNVPKVDAEIKCGNMTPGRRVKTNKQESENGTNIGKENNNIVKQNKKELKANHYSMPSPKKLKFMIHSSASTKSKQNLSLPGPKSGILFESFHHFHSRSEYG